MYDLKQHNITDDEFSNWKAALPRFIAGSAERHWLTDEANRVLRKVVQDSYDYAFNQAEKRVGSGLIKPDDLLEKFSEDLKFKVLQHPALKGSKLDNQQSVINCAIRDFEKDNRRRSFVLNHVCDNNLSKIRKISDDLKRLPSEKLENYRNIATETWDRSIGNNNLQEQVFVRSKEISKQFNLDGVSIVGGMRMSPRQQLRWLDKVDKQLTQACELMGIQKNQWGIEGKSSLELLPGPLGVLQGINGRVNVGNPLFYRMELNMATVEPVRTLVHEFTHLLDNKLAKKVHEIMIKKGLDPNDSASNPDGNLFYSSIKPEYQSLIQKAQYGLAYISMALDDKTTWSSIKNKAEQWLGKYKSYSDTQKESADKINRAVDNLLSSFASSHLGVSKIAVMKKSEITDYRSSLAENDGVFIKTWAKASTEHDPKTAMNMAIESWKQVRSDLNQDLPKFIEIAAKIHQGNEQKIRERVSSECYKEIAEFASISHNMRLFSNESSKMLKHSIENDVVSLSHNMQGYYSQPTELLARIVSRPQEFKDYVNDRYICGWNKVVTPSQLKSMNKGFSMLLDEAGIKRDKEPQLGSQVEVVAGAMVDVLRARDKIPQIFNKWLNNDDALSSKNQSLKK